MTDTRKNIGPPPPRNKDSEWGVKNGFNSPSPWGGSTVEINIIIWILLTFNVFYNKKGLPTKGGKNH